VSGELRLHRDALRELDDAADYYDRESVGLGSVFVDEVEAGLARIRLHSDAAPEIASGVRKLVLARFPYSLIYEPRDDFVRILAVAHQRRRPHYWRERR
jgi:plasmid stabilization system protein ParE